MVVATYIDGDIQDALERLSVTSQVGFNEDSDRSGL